tara:strand:- start:153 stop:320 length:168 start_codon:yes stop_codon:yes gene_type:complete
MSKIKLNKVELKNVKNVGVLVVEKKVDKRKNNPGRPVIKSLLDIFVYKNKHSIVM